MGFLLLPLRARCPPSTVCRPPSAVRPPRRPPSAFHHSVTHSFTHSFTHSLIHSLTHSHPHTHSPSLTRAACVCGWGSIWQLSKGTGCCRARGSGAQNHGRRSTLKTPLPKAWQAQHSVHLGVFSVAGAACGGCLKGQDAQVVARAALWRCHCRNRGSL